MEIGKQLRNQKGFTLVEIIAVLIILGILAAVAVPKYMDLQNEARNSAAQGAIAEIKGRLTTGYGIELLQTKGDAASITLANIYAEAGITAGTAFDVGDFNVTVTGTGATSTITVNSVQTKALSPAVTGTWDMP